MTDKCVTRLQWVNMHDVILTIFVTTENMNSDGNNRDEHGGLKDTIRF